MQKEWHGTVIAFLYCRDLSLQSSRRNQRYTSQESTAILKGNNNKKLFGSKSTKILIKKANKKVPKLCHGRERYKVLKWNVASAVLTPTSIPNAPGSLSLLRHVKCLPTRICNKSLPPRNKALSPFLLSFFLKLFGC